MQILKNIRENILKNTQNNVDLTNDITLDGTNTINDTLSYKYKTTNNLNIFKSIVNEDAQEGIYQRIKTNKLKQVTNTTEYDRKFIRNIYDNDIVIFRRKLIALGYEIHNGYLPEGPPDAIGCYLKDDNTVSVVFGAELYPPFGFQGYTHKLSNGTISNGSKIMVIDLDRNKIIPYIEDESIENPIKRIYDAYDKIYDVNGDILTNIYDTPSNTANSAFCSGSLSCRHKWGNGVGFENDIFFQANETERTHDLVIDLNNRSMYQVGSLGVDSREKLDELNTGHTDFVALALTHYDYPRWQCGTHIWIGKKNKTSTNFLEKNGIHHNSGRIYAFEPDDKSELNWTSWANIDVLDNDGKAETKSLSGKFVKTHWKYPESVTLDILEIEEEKFMRNRYPHANSTNKTEHNTVDPNTGTRYITTTNTSFYCLIDFENSSGILDNVDSYDTDGLPSSIPATMSLIMSQNNNLISPKITNSDGAYWLADNYVYIQEDGSANRLARFSMNQYFDNGKKVNDITIEPIMQTINADYEFSGITDLSGLLVKNSNNEYIVKDDENSGYYQRINNTGKYIVHNCQDHFNKFINPNMGTAGFMDFIKLK